MYMLLPFGVFVITLVAIGIVLGLYHEGKNYFHKRNETTNKQGSKENINYTPTIHNEVSSVSSLPQNVETVNTSNATEENPPLIQEESIIDETAAWIDYDESLNTPISPLPDTQHSKEIKQKTQAKSTKPKQRTLPNSVIREMFEKKYANQYFPALRIVNDNREMQFCPNDGKPLFKAKAICNSELIENAKCCPLCSTAFIKKEIITGDFRTGANTLWVCKYVQTCSHQKHLVVSATGILCRTDLTSVEINIQYCKNCGEYFISKQQYDNYKIIYKNLMGNLKFIDNLKSKNMQLDSQLSLQSPLHINGYTVSQNSKLTEADRQRILGYVIDNDILTKSEVIYYLSMFIDRAQQRRHADMTNAIAKWERDLYWVNHYHIQEQFKIHIGPINAKPKRKL